MIGGNKVNKMKLGRGRNHLNQYQGRYNGPPNLRFGGQQGGRGYQGHQWTQGDPGFHGGQGYLRGDPLGGNRGGGGFIRDEGQGYPPQGGPQGIPGGSWGSPRSGGQGAWVQPWGNRIVSMEWDIIWVGMRTTPMIIRG